MALADHVVVVPDEWIDYNDHLTEGYYGVAFADASDSVLLQAGFDAGYRQTHGTFYTVETHIWFRREVAAGAELRVVTSVLGVDAKRLHLLHDLTVAAERCAVQEAMLLHVGPAGRVGPMAPQLLARFAALTAEHAGREHPPFFGGGIRGVPAPND